jgi:hypothetical protein
MPKKKRQSRGKPLPDGNGVQIAGAPDGQCMINTRGVISGFRCMKSTVGALQIFPRMSI